MLVCRWGEVTPRRRVSTRLSVRRAGESSKGCVYRHDRDGAGIRDGEVWVPVPPLLHVLALQSHSSSEAISRSRAIRRQHVEADVGRRRRRVCRYDHPDR